MMTISYVSSFDISGTTKGFTGSATTVEYRRPVTSFGTRRHGRCCAACSIPGRKVAREMARRDARMQACGGADVMACLRLVRAGNAMVVGCHRRLPSIQAVSGCSISISPRDSADDTDIPRSLSAFPPPARESGASRPLYQVVALHPSTAPCPLTRPAPHHTMGNSQSTATSHGEQPQKPAEQVIRPQEQGTSVQVGILEHRAPSSAHAPP